MSTAYFFSLMRMKRESLCPSSMKIKASATVEALLIVPVVLSVTMFFVWIMEVFRIHAEIGEIVNEAGRDMVYYSYPYSKFDNSPDIFGEAYLHFLIMNSDAYKKISGLSVMQTSLNLEDSINIVVTYSVKPYVAFPGIHGMLLTNRFYSKAFLGVTKRYDKDTVYVYITKNSEVYHTGLGCRALKNVVSSTTESEIGSKRNKSGAKYYQCSKCKNYETGGIVFYTPYGNRYHSSEACSDLNTFISKIPLEEVGEKRKCLFCQ